MKRKYNINNMLTSIFLSILIVLQSLSLPVIVNASDNFEVAIDRFNTDESSVPVESDELDQLLPVNKAEAYSSSQSPVYSMSLKSTSTASENGWIYQASFEKGFIEWQVDIKAKDEFGPSIPYPLDGLKFSNVLDPKNLGTYVEDSFSVNGVAVTPDYNSEGILTYTFPEDSGNDATITYKGCQKTDSKGNHSL